MIVERQVLVEAAPAEVFSCFVEPELLAAWLGIAAEVEARPGGIFRFEVAPGQFCSGHYVEVRPPDRVVFTWGWESDVIPVPPASSRVEVDLVAAGAGTLVTLRHSGLPETLTDMHAEGWTTFLDRLAALCAGRDPGAHPAAEIDPAELRARVRAEEADD